MPCSHLGGCQDCEVSLTQRGRLNKVFLSRDKQKASSGKVCHLSALLFFSQPCKMYVHLAARGVGLAWNNVVLKGTHACS